MQAKNNEKRLFIAIDLPDEVKKVIEKFEKKFYKIKWASLPQLHITLNFLGKTKAEHIEPIKSTLATIDAPAFELKLAGTGFFPNRRRPSVFWLGLEKQPLLTELKNTIDQALQAETGQEPEEREFIPHLTLARFRRAPFKDIITALEDEFPKLPNLSFTASRFLLYSSELTQNGAIHTIEQEYLLK